MAADPKPWLRSRCVHRAYYGPEAAWMLSPADPYYDRCPVRPTQEDGLCDWCRGEPTCAAEHPSPNAECCRCSGGPVLHVNLRTPCLSIEPVGVPF